MSSVEYCTPGWVASGTTIISGNNPNTVSTKKGSCMLDCRVVLSRIQHFAPGPGRWLPYRIYDYIEKLVAAGINVEIHWVPGHTGVEGNGWADEAAKQAARSRSHCNERLASLTHVSRHVTELKRKECRKYLSLSTEICQSQLERPTSFSVKIGA